MAAGDLGSVQSRSQHQNGDTHVGLGDDVFSDAGSTPAASTTYLALASRVSSLAGVRCQPVALSFDPREVEEPDRGLDSGRTQVHVPLRGRQVLMPGKLLNRARRRTLHCQVRTERVPQDVNPNLPERPSVKVRVQRILLTALRSTL